MIHQYTRDRKLAERDEAKASSAARAVVKLLRRGKLKMSMRDAAELLGISHQRMHQLAETLMSYLRAPEQVPLGRIQSGRCDRLDLDRYGSSIKALSAGSADRASLGVQRGKWMTQSSR